jgi:hypothetical protein
MRINSIYWRKTFHCSAIQHRHVIIQYLSVLETFVNIVYTLQQVLSVDIVAEALPFLRMRKLNSFKVKMVQHFNLWSEVVLMLFHC